jgi:hypothetical protein
MKITYSLTTNPYEDWRQIYTVSIDGKEVVDCSDGEPEDNTLYRNFNDVLKIPDLMKLAFEAGKRGEELEIEEVKEKEE